MTATASILKLSALPICLIFLLGCAGGPAPTPAGSTVVINQDPTELDDTANLVNRYLAEAARLDSPAAEQRLLQAVSIVLDMSDADNAAAILGNIDSSNNSLPDTLGVEIALAWARVELLRNNPQEAQEYLRNLTINQTTALPTELRIRAAETRSQVLLAADQFLAAARELTQLSPLLDSAQSASNKNRIWDILSAAPPASLTQSQLIDSYELRGWLELLNIVNANQENLEQQVDAVARWQTRWTQHSAARELPGQLAFTVEILRNLPQRVALLIPLSEAAGRAVNEGFMAAYYEAVGQGQQVPEVEVYDTSGLTDILPLYHQAVSSGVDMVIGPLRNESVRQLQRQEALPVPTLALNYGDGTLPSPAGFYQFGLAPEDEIRQVARLAWLSGHRSAAVLTPEGEDYRGIQQYFIDSWQALGGDVVSVASFAGSGTYSDVIRRMLNIDASEARAAQLTSVLPRRSLEFIPRRRQDVDFVFMMASPGEARQLRPTFAFHFAGDLPIYATPAIYDGNAAAINNRDLNGVLFVDAPWILLTNDTLQQQTQTLWPNSSAAVRRLRAMGVDAFRLHARIAQMANFPDTRIPGATGALSMREDGSITRQLIPARLNEGVLEFISVEPAS